MYCSHCRNEVINDKEIRQIIREELMHLDPDVANSMLTQLTMRLGRSIRTQGAMRHYEVKHCQDTTITSNDDDDNEVAHDEY